MYVCMFVKILNGYSIPRRRYRGQYNVASDKRYKQYVFYGEFHF